MPIISAPAIRRRRLLQAGAAGALTALSQPALGVGRPAGTDGLSTLLRPARARVRMVDYAFIPPDAGTFWYHSHDNSLVQMGRGLAGALIVEEFEPPAVDRDLLWTIQDWRLSGDAQIAPGFNNRMEAAMDGRVGNTVTI